jgi:hypothetical protein
MMWRVTEFPNGAPARVSIAHDPKEVAMTLRLTPAEGHYRVERMSETPRPHIGGEPIR